jgi:hypothetical protein
MPDLARDTFTDSAYRVLTLHVEEVNGSSWSGFASSTEALISPVGRLFRSGYHPVDGPDQPDGADCFLGFTPPTADYIVECELHWLGAYGGTGTPLDVSLDFGVLPPITEDDIPTGPPGEERYINATGVNNNPSSGSNHRFYIYARIQSAPAHECYTFGYETTGSRYVLCKNQADRSTDGPTYEGWNLTTAAPAWSDGEMRLLALKVEGNVITGSVNGVDVLTTTQTDYSSAGTVGLEFKGGSSPVRGFHADNFKVLPITSTPPTVTTRNPLEVLGASGIEVIHGCN